MDFDFTPEQESLRKMIRDFGEKEILPQVREYDRDERFPLEIVQKAAELGLLGGVVPAEYGGAGLDYVTYTLIIEEMARYCNIVAAALSAPSGLVGSGILEYGREDQKQKYLKPLAQGRVWGGAGVTEPHSGTDVGAMETTLTPDGDGYRINGSKMWISFIDLAGWFLTFATIDRSKKHRGITAFIIEKDTPGLSVRPIKNKLGFRPITTGEIILDNCWIPKEALVGEVGQGFKVAMCAVENGRLTVGARALGIAQACLEASVKYAQERIVFDQPIGNFQLVQAKIADMVVGVESARFLIYRLAVMKDQGIKDARREASIAKMYAADIAMRSATDAMQIHGAYSVSDEYPVGRYFRDAKVLQIVEGQNDLHRGMIAEYALGKREPRN